MKINHIKSDILHIVEFEGRLDALGNSKTEEFFKGLTDNPELNVLVDCEKLDFINSSGLRVLIMSLKKLKAVGKDLILCNLQKNIKEVFQFSGFTNLFDIELDRDGALKLFQ